MSKQNHILSLIVLGAFSSTVNAALYASNCQAGDVSTPCTQSAWSVGIDALSFRSEDNQLSGQQVNPFRASQGYGYMLEAGYHFNNGTDINLNWHRYKKTSSGNTTNNPLGNTLTSKFKILNLELGQEIDIANAWDLRFQAGLQSVELTNDSIVTDQFIPPQLSNNRVKGLGPRGGAKVKYHLGRGFKLYSEGNIGLLISKVTENFTGSFSHTNVLSTDIQGGASYTHVLKSNGELTARVGWGVKHFTGQGLGSVGAISNVDSLSWSGWNAGLNWRGNL